MTPKRPYPDDYPSERERQEKAEGGRFSSQIKKLPHLGGASAGRITLLHQDGTSKPLVFGAIARMAPDGQSLLPCPEKPQPAALCGCDGWRSSDRLGHSPRQRWQQGLYPLRQEQNFLANDWKKKRRLKGAFLTVLRDRRERR